MHILYHPCTTGLNSTSSIQWPASCLVGFCLLLFDEIFLICICHGYQSVDLFHFCVSIWLWYEGDLAFIERIYRECLPFCSFNNLWTLEVIFFWKSLEEFSIWKIFLEIFGRTWSCDFHDWEWLNYWFILFPKYRSSQIFLVSYDSSWVNCMCADIYSFLLSLLGHLMCQHKLITFPCYLMGVHCNIPFCLWFCWFLFFISLFLLISWAKLS